MQQQIATNDNSQAAGQAVALAHRLEASFADLASTQMCPSAPIMWEANPKADQSTIQQLSTLIRDKLEADVQTVDAMLTYGAAKSSGEFAVATVQLMGMPTAQKDEMESAAYGQMLWTHFSKVPLWAVRIAVDRCTGSEVFRPMPVTLSKYLPIQIKRAMARAWELKEALAARAARDVQEAKQDQGDAEREARIAALTVEDRARYDQLMEDGNWFAAAKLIARKPDPLPNREGDANTPKNGKLGFAIREITQGLTPIPLAKEG